MLDKKLEGLKLRRPKEQNLVRDYFNEQMIRKKVLFDQQK